MIEQFFSDNQDHIKSLLGEKFLYKVTPNSLHRIIDWKHNRPIIKADFYSSNRIAQQLFSSFHPDSHIRNKELFSTHPLRFDTGTLNPATGEQNGRRSAEASWSAARDAATSSGNGAAAELSSQKSGSQFWNFRCFEPFLTSSIVATSVLAANLQGYRDDSLEILGNSFQNADTTTAEIVVSTEVDPTSYAASDFANVTFSSKGSLAFSATTNNQYSAITITDPTIISLSGYTKLCLITGRDLSNSAPTGNNALTFQNRIQANPPILTVTYVGGGDYAQFI